MFPRPLSPESSDVNQGESNPSETFKFLWNILSQIQYDTQPPDLFPCSDAYEFDLPCLR